MKWYFFEIVQSLVIQKKEEFMMYMAREGWMQVGR